MGGPANDEALPFGQTDVTATELRQLIDVEVAADLLAGHGIPDAKHRIRWFINTLPELLAWFRTHGREFPWRHTRDPWRVYISEILLQRTRASSVEDVYNQFFERFSGPAAIRVSNEQEIRELVSPLGFGNQRTRTLMDVARILGEDHNDEVPDSIGELKRPWRVGPYSARATLIFAFNHSLALVDANIARIIERVFDYEMPNQPHKSDSLYRFLDALIPTDAAVARAVNLALLDLGNGVCISSSPRCEECPLSSGCRYWRNQ